MRFGSVIRAIIAGARVPPELLEAAMPRIRHLYQSDLSDEDWTLLEPLLTPSERHGRPTSWAAWPYSRRCVLPLEERLCLADASAGVPALADRVLPLPQVAPERPTA
jgi:hypothetical protein